MTIFNNNLLSSLLPSNRVCDETNVFSKMMSFFLNE